MSSNREAYEGGFHFGPHYDNPYHPSSREFDDFERGWTQRLKRSSSDWEADASSVGK
ncbi:hypothetical protein [Photobacterium sp. 1_MG-2023]|uniref:hypothetical protein n=1 Tax=Photobacterium sp. 1_MG-2023 TaxID=3062646 RepID=UPI0026E1585F|nr:hypothetical protein [Photobacterium sp. 1_MG-2023]MDO6706767.1 hypothetical protein [Photobacterium sp. 1_MG-2023]